MEIITATAVPIRLLEKPFAKHFVVFFLLPDYTYG